MSEKPEEKWLRRIRGTWNGCDADVPDAFEAAVRDFVRSVASELEGDPRYAELAIVERLAEPDRAVQLKVVWEDDEGRVRIHRGWRVQHSCVLGPYKGGLRFRPDLDLSTLRALAFEQVFKNALTGLPLGGAKGVADFDPSDASPREVRRFCHAFMRQLVDHLGPNVDVPAGDQGVGAREIGYLYGAYRALRGRPDVALTGKPLSSGGVPLRTEATGYGAVYFLRAMLARVDRGVEDARVAVSGAGNVSLHAAEKAVDLGAKVVTLSDSDGLLHAPDGLSAEQVATAKRLKLEERARVGEVADALGLEYREGETPWGVEADVLLPSATEHELDGDAAGRAIEAGARFVVEGSNLPCTDEARQRFRRAGVARAPGKAANAGGVAVSFMEMAASRTGRQPGREEIDRWLAERMNAIHRRCEVHAGEDRGGWIDYGRGANVAALRRITDGIDAQGIG
ncbi:MAG TPA: Glu/Leu/Phe/Val dehydrogenase dimerization domain-containing protein [Sandaracinaceae bacterium LLY-WYZ-13_1]|nr:Glu/Leu/Phe/Val dehydrogenase dimerization domain-containing protein [Sandaracinaceae bacterium LLY-WYZ-13_1]